MRRPETIVPPRSPQHAQPAAPKVSLAADGGCWASDGAPGFQGAEKGRPPEVQLHENHPPL
eukprot:5645039-Pyramimonas_sp.AAC.1